MNLNSLTSLGSQFGGMSQEGGLQSQIKSGVLDFLSNKVNLKPSAKRPPLPKPPVPKAIKPTAFQISPFAEKVLVDPYKTYNLNVLSQTELAIDDVADYLASILPKDLIKDLMANAQLAGALLKQGMDLASMVMQIKNALPANLNLASLLRKVDIGLVLSGTGSLLASATLRKLNLGNLPSIFIEDAFSFMRLQSQFSGSSKHYDQYENLSINAQTGISSPYYSNGVTNAAISYAQIQVVNKYPVDTISVYNRLPLSKPIQLLKLSNTMNSSRFNVLASSINVYGLINSQNLIDATYAKSTDVKGLITELGSATKLAEFKLVVNDLNGIVARHATETTLFITAIDKYGLTLIQNLTQAVLNNDTVTMASIKAQILASDLFATSQSVDGLIATIATLGVDATSVVNMAIGSSVATILHAVAIDTYFLQTNDTKGLSVFNSIIDMIDLTATSSVDLFSSVIQTTDQALLSNNLNQLSQLSSDDISAIVIQLSNQEPMTFIDTIQLDSVIREALIREALQVAAENGNYRMVFNIFLNSNIIFTAQYCKYLVRTILQGFKLTDDLLALGIDYVKTDLTDVLNTLCPNWHLLNLNTHEFYDQSMFLKASDDALSILAKIFYSAIPAQIQLDNRYVA